MKPTFEQRLEALERVCFNGVAAHVTPTDESSHRILLACQNVVCAYYVVPVAWMRIRNRTKKVAFIRQMAMALSLELSGMSSKGVADLFNRANHGTVLHARDVITKWQKRRVNYQIIQELRRRIVNGMKDE